MSRLKAPSAQLERPAKGRGPSRLAQFSDRVAKSIPAAVRGEPLPARSEEPVEEVEYVDDGEWYDVVPRFPIVRSGYECRAVDEHVAALERELAELDQEVADLRARDSAQDAVESEIQRIGEQTSAILLAAHERARETTRLAQEQADRCLADAAANANAITAEAHRKLAAVEEDIKRVTGERGRLLADMEALAGTLSTVARDATTRFPAPVKAE